MITIDLRIDEAAIGRLKGKVKKFAVEVIQDLNEAVVMATPYITGNLRGSWYASLNGEPDARSGPPDAGGGAVARLNMVVAELAIGDIYRAANGAIYAPFVEYGTRHMAPRAFVRNTVDRAPAIAQAVISRIADEP